MLLLRLPDVTLDRRFSAALVMAICFVPTHVADIAAHHSLATDFDITKPVTLTGRVTKIEWLNPHVHIYIVAKDNGKDDTWSIELGSPNGLKARGWTAKSLKIGDVVTVNGSRAKDGSRLANASSIVLPNGVRLPTGTAAGKTS
jgi:hypothetical protein